MNIIGSKYILYYGNEVPRVEESTQLNNTYVVIQPYHPLCQNVLFREFFPHCKRYVYWNCSSIHDGELKSASDKELNVISYSNEWNSHQLDLNHSETREYLKQKALEIINYQDIHGLFVDDMDTWGDTPQKQIALLTLLREITAQASKPIRFFVNRGFSFWHRIPNLDAILLENMTQKTFADDADLWTQNIYKMNIKHLKMKRPEIPLFGLSYEAEKNEETFDEKLPYVFSDIQYKDVSLSNWPEEFYQ